MAPVGSLDSTLATLTDLVAQENHKTVVLECSGLQLVPPRYQATIKNVAIQLIRNAVVHGIEAPDAARSRRQTGPCRTCIWNSKRRREPALNCCFKTTAADSIRTRCAASPLPRVCLSEEDAKRLRDRQAIKLIFKSGFTTMTDSRGEAKHGSGMSLVRRYVHEAGGKIALASILGDETRFKVTLPALKRCSRRAGRLGVCPSPIYRAA